MAGIKIPEQSPRTTSTQSPPEAGSFDYMDANDLKRFRCAVRDFNRFAPPLQGVKPDSEAAKLTTTLREKAACMKQQLRDLVGDIEEKVQDLAAIMAADDEVHGAENIMRKCCCVNVTCWPADDVGLELDLKVLPLVTGSIKFPSFNDFAQYMIEALPKPFPMYTARKV
jgi:hypothetical protein